MSNITATDDSIRDLPPLKVPVNRREDSKIRKHCARIGQRVAPWLRQVAIERIDRDTPNRTCPARKSEWPRHGHLQRLPSRASMARGGMRQRL
jgi:hypothetical protein